MSVFVFIAVLLVLAIYGLAAGVKLLFWAALIAAIICAAIALVRGSDRNGPSV